MGWDLARWVADEVISDGLKTAMAAASSMRAETRWAIVELRDPALPLIYLSDPHQK